MQSFRGRRRDTYIDPFDRMLIAQAMVENLTGESSATAWDAMYEDQLELTITASRVL